MTQLPRATSAHLRERRHVLECSEQSGPLSSVMHTDFLRCRLQRVSIECSQTLIVGDPRQANNMERQINFNAIIINSLKA